MAALIKTPRRKRQHERREPTHRLRRKGGKNQVDERRITTSVRLEPETPFNTAK